MRILSYPILFKLVAMLYKCKNIFDSQFPILVTFMAGSILIHLT